MNKPGTAKVGVPLKFPKYAKDTIFKHFYHFLSAKKCSKNTPETRKLLFLQLETQKIHFFKIIFLGEKSHSAENSFSSQNYFSHAEINYENGGYPPTKWKFRKDALMRKIWKKVFSTIIKKTHQFHRIKTKEKRKTPLRFTMRLFPFQKTSRNQKLQKKLTFFSIVL